MKITKKGPVRFELTVHAYELSALLAAARWAIEQDGDDLPKEARRQLRQMIEEVERSRENREYS